MENCTSHLHGVMCALLFAIFQCSVRSEDRDAGFSPAHQLLNLAICLSKCPVMQFLKRGTLSTMPEWVIQQHMGRVNKEISHDLPGPAVKHKPSSLFNLEGKKQSLIFSFTWKNKCVCNSWGLVSCFHHNKESHLDVYMCFHAYIFIFQADSQPTLQGSKFFFLFSFVSLQFFPCP